MALLDNTDLEVHAAPVEPQNVLFLGESRARHRSVVPYRDSTTYKRAWGGMGGLFLDVRLFVLSTTFRVETAWSQTLSFAEDDNMKTSMSGCLVLSLSCMNLRRNIQSPRVNSNTSAP